MSVRRLATPRPADVRIGADGVPTSVGASAIEAIVEDWLVEDRWWTGRPLRRRYLEVILAGGVDAVVFCDLTSGRWFSQRG